MSRYTAAYWRDRALRTAEIAAQVTYNEEIHRTLLKVAADYNRLSEMAGLREKKHPSLSAGSRSFE